MNRWINYLFIISIIISGFLLGYNLPHSSYSLKETEIQKSLQLEQDIRNNIELLLTVQSIVMCESAGKHDGVWGDHGHSYGIGQFKEHTFYWLAKKAGFKKMKWHNVDDQLKLLLWAVENHYGDLWTCYRKLQ